MGSPGRLAALAVSDLCCMQCVCVCVSVCVSVAHAHNADKHG